jgi:hypothetical protein
LEDLAARVAELEEELRWAKSKIAAQQLDLDRWAEKNRLWASEKVEKIVFGQQEYPRAKTWKLYQQSQSDHLSDLNQESDRQVAERNRWVDPPVQGTSQ